MRKKKAAVWLLAIAMLMGCLAGCSGQPKTAKDVYEAHIAHDDIGEHNITGKITMGISMNAEGITVDMPIDIELDMDVKGDMSHGSMSVSASMLGEKIAESIEMYGDKDYTYAYSEDEGVWEKSPVEDADGNLSELLASELFENAEMEYSKEDKAYIVTVSGSEMADSNIFKSMIDLTGSDAAADEAQAVLDAFAKGVVKYTFDDNCYLQSIAMEDMNCTTTVEESGEEYEMTLSMGMELSFSRYGDIKDIVIPEEALNAGTESEGDDWNDSDDETYVSEDGRLEIEGEANDADISALSERIQEADPDYDGLYISYDTDGTYASLLYWKDEGEWTHDLSVTRIKEGYYCTAEERFRSMLDFYGSDWYKAEPVLGSEDDGFALFYDNSNVWTEIQYLAAHGDAYIEIDVSYFGDDEPPLSDFVEKANELLELGGYSTMEIPKAA